MNTSDSYTQAVHKDPTPSLVASGSAFTHPAERSAMDCMGSTGTPLTMNSEQIADMVGSRHDKVKQSIERMADRGVIQLPPMRDVKNSGGQTVRQYIFQGDQGKRASFIVVAQLSPEFTADLVDRWQELEANVAKQQIMALPDFTNPPMAARAWASEFEGRVLALEVVKAQEQKIAKDAPKVEFYDYIAEAHGCHTMKQVADMLDTGRNHLYEYLRKHKVLISTGKDRNLPYQVHKNAGRFTVLEEPYKHPYTGKITLSATTVVTGKGLIFIQELVSINGRDGL